MLPIELERVLCFGPRKLTMVWGPKGVASTVFCICRVEENAGSDADEIGCTLACGNCCQEAPNRSFSQQLLDQVLA